ncbi:hypothetical protein VB712_13500 [Spirulina sp. CCNP1310]|uniref:hypothetical protein n=1 Tax=Spirulina sp. CCNP1310 TaxID=3110249 RepID=UPI002B218E35|nr:hypothetical protein [Spirulina sp. CCNP1310]MEA5420240.1 hypothetical protein [Spirulina sp. CCNP1310]
MNIQPSGDAGQSMPPLNNAQDLINAFYGLSNAGDRVKLFFDVAQSRPGDAFPWFVTILKNRSEPPLRALSLQGLGHITHEPTRLDITSGQSEYSIELLHLLAEEIKGSKSQSNDLTRWAAAYAIGWLPFSKNLLSHVEGGALTEPPDRIRREIFDRKWDEMERVERLNSRGNLTVDYERYLEFWLYAGAMVDFLNSESISRRFLEVAGDVVNFLFVWGIELGVRSRNRDIQKIALEFAKQRFTTDEVVEQRVYKILKQFLSEDYQGDLGFQRMAAEAVVQAGNWLDRGELTKAAILCERWERIVQIGEPAVPTLEKVVWKVLQFSTKPKIDLERAVQTIGKINFSSRDQKLRVLSKILLHQHNQIRETVAKILKDYSIKPDEFPIQVSNIIEVITHTWNLDESKLNDSTLSELSQILQNLDGTKDLLRNLESQAISEAKGLGNEFELSSVSTEKHLSQTVNDNLKTVDILCNKIVDLSTTIQDFQRRIESNTRLLKISIEKIVSLAQSSIHVSSSIVNYLKTSNGISYIVVFRDVSPSTYNKCIKTSNQLNEIKSCLISRINKKYPNMSVLLLVIIGAPITTILLFGLIESVGIIATIIFASLVIVTLVVSYYSATDFSVFEKIIENLKKEWI